MRGSDVNWEGAAYLGVTEQPDLRGPRYDQRENTGRAERRFYSLGYAGSGCGSRSLVCLAGLARQGRVVHVEVEPAVKSRGVSAQRFPGGAEQVLPWLISGSGQAGRGQHTGGRPEGSAGCADGGAGGAECVPQASEVN